jgi:hypothetical protein
MISGRNRPRGLSLIVDDDDERKKTPQTMHVDKKYIFSYLNSEKN